MDDRWDDRQAARWPGPLGACVYGSRLLGAEVDLVLHGGGNTSVKTRGADPAGREVDVLWVKGSGWDLASIEPAGFAPLRLDQLTPLLLRERLPDPEMVNALRCARLDAGAPDPSVETLLHALLPHAAILHSHADALLTLTNSVEGERRVREVFGNRVVVVPYVMPGFDLARRCALDYPRKAHQGTVGLVLAHHGLFTFGATTREAYARHVELISLAEEYLGRHTGGAPPSAESAATGALGGTTGGSPADALAPSVEPAELAELRRRLSAVAGAPLVVSRHTDRRTMRFVRRPDLASVSQRGPATPDHVLRTKRLPLVGRDVEGYARTYTEAFRTYAGDRALTMLDPAPRVVLDPNLGMLTAGRTRRDAAVARDIYLHTIGIVERAEALGGYQVLPAAELFDVEYWDLEQAKLRRAGAAPDLAGEVAVVSGAASGIGRACAAALLARGAVVVGLDVAATVTATFPAPDFLGLRTDVTDRDDVATAVRTAVERFGGVDVMVASAGTFGRTSPVAEHDQAAWRATFAVNLDGVALLLAALHPMLARAPRGGRVVVVGSKNVPAPGPGAAAYSASKAAATQLARVAALEWAADGIRVHTVHPDGVFDTGLWSNELLTERAARYSMSVSAYKRRNLLGAEVTSRDVGEVVAALIGPAFAVTTGLQVPVDGGNERVL